MAISMYIFVKIYKNCTKIKTFSQKNNKVIKELFPFCDIAFISGADKSVTCGDIFIDDRPECLNSVKGNYKYIWCFGVYNWNKNWDGIRVNSWKEVKHKIDEIMRRNL